MTRFEALKAVRSHFVSEQAMADAFNVTQPTVWRWLNQSKQLPAEHCRKASAMTGVGLFDLRPDIYSREMMVDQSTSDRLCAVDLHAGALRVRRVSTCAGVAK